MTLQVHIDRLTVMSIVVHGYCHVTRWCSSETTQSFPHGCRRGRGWTLMGVPCGLLQFTSNDELDLRH